MKALFAGLMLLLGLGGVSAAPAPPVLIGVVPGPTNGFWVTNISFVYTNTAVRTLTIDLGQVTIFGTNALNNATVLSWFYSTAPTVWSYKVYYGQTSGGPTNTFLVSSNINTVAFFSSLATNAQWWAYATALDTATNESLPSNQILFIPLH
jgi:hypothetical protein